MLKKSALVQARSTAEQGIMVYREGFLSQGKPRGVLRPARSQKLAWDRLTRTCAGLGITATTPTPTKEAPGSARGQKCHEKNRQIGCGLRHVARQFLWEGTALKFGHFSL